MNKETEWICQALDELNTTAYKDGTYWRATYSTEDVEGVKLIKKWMKENGLKTSFDEIGNLYGTVNTCVDEPDESGGISSNPGTIIVGSHRDTVKNGGKYDGALGIITAIAAVSNLVKKNGLPLKKIEVAALCEEEGSRFLSGYIGSRAMAGELTENDLLEKDSNGFDLKTTVQNFTGKSIDMEKLKKKRDCEQFIELHIEQGQVLEKSNKQIGIVTDIVGLLIGTIMIYGEQNHAGTTPMDMRKDALVKAARIITLMTDWVTSLQGKAVCTFGSIKIDPGKSNVIPEKIQMTFDIRSGSEQILSMAKKKLDQLENCKDMCMQVQYACQDKAAKMDEGGINSLKKIAENNNLSYMKLSSGAGHDAQIMSRRVKTNMIFVPSVGGVSHSLKEYTKKEDIEAGYIMLRDFIEELAWNK